MAYIVAVDDDPEWRDLYEQTFAACGHEVRTFADGDAALADMKGRLPNLVILDLRMYPSGRQLLWFIRRFMPGIPVIIFSGYTEYSGEPDFAEVVFLSKSGDLDRLTAAVDSALAKD